MPSDLRDRVGSRFLIRSVRGYVDDDARLVAAFLAVSLSRSFDALRRGAGMVDVKKSLEKAQRNGKGLEPDGEREVGYRLMLNLVASSGTDAKHDRSQHERLDDYLRDWCHEWITSFIWITDYPAIFCR